MDEPCSSVGMTRKDEPAAATLRAFVAAGRRESLRLAAEELGLTPSAISHQVRAMEEWVGTALFVRETRRVRLTPAGRILLEQLTAGFDAISAALAGARGQADDRSLRISALPLFTGVWLIPRLEQFSRYATRHGVEVTLAIDTSSDLADLDGQAADVAIRNVAVADARLVSRKLLDIGAVPLCTADLAGALSGPADLRGATLIHQSTRPDGWQRWLEAVGCAQLRPRANLTVDTVPAAIEAAAAGHGVMLGLDPLIWDSPALVRLVIPFRAPRISAGTFFVVHRRADRSRRAVQVFVAWLLAEMRADRRRLSTLSAKAWQAIEVPSHDLHD